VETEVALAVHLVALEMHPEETLVELVAHQELVLLQVPAMADEVRETVTDASSAHLFLPLLLKHDQKIQHFAKM
jgi:hypothetical protein